MPFVTFRSFSDLKGYAYLEETNCGRQNVLALSHEGGGTPICFTLLEEEFKFYTYLNCQDPEVWHYCDMTRWIGKELTLEVEAPI